jgi:tubulin-folding cofactor B
MVTKETAKHMPTVHQCAEMLELRHYVTANDASRFDGMAAGQLRLDVTHSNLQQRWHDLPFHEDMSVMQVKEKLYRHGGTGVAWQELYLRRGQGDTVFLVDDNKPLSFYGVRSGMEIHIKDLDPHSISLHGGLEDVSQVQKYEMEDEEYDKMKNTVRAIRREKEAEAARAAAARKQEEGEDQPTDDGATPYELTLDEVVAAFPIGSRCECDPGARRGTVRHAGPIVNTKGLWIGICLDEPQGHNDGTKDGKRYFECLGDKYGIFVKPPNVRVGDYPERDPFASDDEF